jgi:hypothetical protein
VIGAYPDGMPWNLRRGDPAEHDEVVAKHPGGSTAPRPDQPFVAVVSPLWSGRLASL